jgi:hypothetical protein
MAFKNLEERFNATVNDLYAGATTKFAGGRASNRTNDDPLMVVGPGENRRGIQQEGRSLPFVSAPRDVVRLTRFSLSPKGILFLAKQQLLQTGNTFAQTKLINPAFVVANAVPFLHVRRHLRPDTGKFGIDASRDSVRVNARLLGQLQSSTFKSVTAKYTLNRGGQLPGLGARLDAALSSIAGPLKSTFSAFTAKRDIGEEGGRIAAPSIWPSGFGKNVPVDAGWKTSSRPEIGTITAETDDQIKKYHQDTDKFFEEFGGGIETEVSIPTSESSLSFATIGDPLPSIITLTSQPFLKYFNPTKATEADNPEVSISTRLDQTNARDRAAEARREGRRISYIRDPLNDAPIDPLGNILDSYKDHLKTISDTGERREDDPILVSFAMGKDEHVQFRAFIRDLNQTATPDYKTYQYIGRIEKFIMYNSVQREVSFKLDLLAFSDKELKNVWTRLNYLTSFVFPYGFNKGILQPNIVRFTIGKVFMDQPGYVTSFSTNFNETAESWDIGAEVPIAATVNMNFMIIEKDTKFADKPFYGITGDSGSLSDGPSSTEPPSTQ